MSLRLQVPYLFWGVTVRYFWARYRAIGDKTNLGLAKICFLVRTHIDVMNLRTLQQSLFEIDLLFHGIFSTVLDVGLSIYSNYDWLSI